MKTPAKTCSTCLQRKSIDNFTINRSRKDGLNHNCRDCQREYNKQHYRNNKKYYSEKARKNESSKLEDIKALIVKLKSQPCTDCGISYPPYVMDFDHVKGTKKFGIGTFRHHIWSPEKIQAEIDKCELVCANCHRIRTHRRMLS